MRAAVHVAKAEAEDDGENNAGSAGCEIHGSPSEFRDDPNHGERQECRADLECGIPTGIGNALLTLRKPLGNDLVGRRQRGRFRSTKGGTGENECAECVRNAHRRGGGTPYSH